MQRLASFMSHHFGSLVSSRIRSRSQIITTGARGWAKPGIRAIGLGLLTLGLVVVVPLLAQIIGYGFPAAIAVPDDGSSLRSQMSTASKPTLRPPNPQLGDTLSVLIKKDHGSNLPSPQASPQITLGKKVYPAFPLKTINNATATWRALIPTTPLDSPGAKQLVINHGNAASQSINFTLANREFPTQSLWIDDSGNGLEPTDAEWDQVSAFKRIVTPEKMWQGKFMRPNEGEITTGFGVRRYYNGVFAEDYYHRGVDYGGGYGSPVIAPAGGVVRLVGYVDQGFRLHGNTVGIDHGQGVLSIFLHLSKITVQPGEAVAAGQMIGEVGSTGAATGPHLHWGLYVQGESVDPTPWRYGDIE